MGLRRIFVSRVDKRVRAGWRILFFFSVYFSTLILLFIPARLFFGYDPLELSSRSMLAGGLVNAISVGIALTLSRRILDQKSIGSLGTKPDKLRQDVLIGFGLAGLMMLIIYGWMTAAGWLRFEAFIWQEVPISTWGLNTLNMFLLFLLTGITEEIQFRGYVLQNIEEGLSAAWGIVLSSIIFASLHLGNPNGNQLAPMVGLLLAGLFFAFAYLRTRSLWLATGLHFGWNFFESVVFGFRVSGLSPPGWLRTTISGPEIWTGGLFGPEGGLVLLPALLVGAALIFWYTRSR